MPMEITEGLLFDLLEKRRAGKFTADELLWAADHPEIVRWARTNPAIVGGLMDNAFMVTPGWGYKITYDQSLGLSALIHRAVGPENLGRINSNITPERFPLKGTGIRTVKCRVEPFLSGETSEQAAVRLTAVGYKLANTGDLAGFLHDHPDKVEKWVWVLAISEDSRWTDLYDSVYMPCARVRGTDRYFGLNNPRDLLDSGFGVLILCD